MPPRSLCTDCNQCEANIHFTSVEHGNTTISVLCSACFSKRSNGFQVEPCLCEYCGATAQMASRGPIESAFGLWPPQKARRELLCDPCYLGIVGLVNRRISLLREEGLNPDFMTITDGMIEAVRKSALKRKNGGKNKRRPNQ